MEFPSVQKFLPVRSLLLYRKHPHCYPDCAIFVKFVLFLSLIPFALLSNAFKIQYRYIKLLSKYSSTESQSDIPTGVDPGNF